MSKQTTIETTLATDGKRMISVDESAGVVYLWLGTRKHSIDAQAFVNVCKGSAKVDLNKRLTLVRGIDGRSGSLCFKLERFENQIVDQVVNGVIVRKRTRVVHPDYPVSDYGNGTLFSAVLNSVKTGDTAKAFHAALKRSEQLAIERKRTSASVEATKYTGEAPAIVVTADDVASAFA